MGIFSFAYGLRRLCRQMALSLHHAYRLRADAALSPTAALPTVAPDADTVTLWASAPDSDSTRFRDGWTSRVSCSHQSGRQDECGVYISGGPRPYEQGSPYRANPRGSVFGVQEPVVRPDDVATTPNTAKRESRYVADAALLSAMERIHLYSLRRRQVVRTTGDPAGLASTADQKLLENVWVHTHSIIVTYFFKLFCSASDAKPVAPSSLAEPTPSSTELIVRPEDAELSARPAIPSEIITNVLLVQLTCHLTGLAKETIEEARTAQPSLKTTTEGAVNVNEALAATLAAARTSLQE
ncbi:hypothetical protein THAOC_17529 [Thalassiosira oceanica]|uniref:Uncharacterized protein n=1 Tax=Thalassiosira oceanica TaxID=159749 RepID=K0SAA6_THAOC|nr:hypothetical protein THAOC_17529 [Thalassiosira oceanica]|eukprot:EJK61894.1 hypothetical protein THAOC_17529 [Thalassiosira oceanica]